MLMHRNIWQSGTNWDDKLETQDRYQCEKLTEAFMDTPEITIPRWVPKENQDLHVFVDASIRAIGVAVYARRESNLSSKPYLIYGKSRLVSKKRANNKSATISRWELLAVALGTRIIEFLRQESEVKSVYLWTDSACAIHWIKKPPIGSRYITNRTTEIEGVKGIMLHHVKTADNPADLAFHGVLPKVLKDSSICWNGLSWLVHPLERWPREEFDEVQERICRAFGLIICTKLTSAIRTIIVDVKRFFSLPMVIKFTARVSGGKFKSLTEFTKEGRFTCCDYELTKKLVVRMAQSEVSQEDIEKWGLVRDADNLWKSLGSRSKLTNFPYFICKGRIAELIVKQCHKKVFHASANLTWVKDRQMYWMSHGKPHIKTIL
uniref:Uncharacterized protein n=1 Tax=Onchocerca volvulus TaxID=6282 RepID=A0A8R1XPA8_ONCVO